MTEHNNTKLRAVFLAALMVLWVFAGAVAFTGSAAAAASTGVIEDNGATDDIDQDATTHSITDVIINDSTSTAFDEDSVTVFINLSNITAADVDISDASLDVTNVTTNTSDSAGGNSDDVTSSAVSSTNVDTTNDNASITLDLAAADVEGSNSIAVSVDINGLDTSNAENTTAEYGLGVADGSSPTAVDTANSDTFGIDIGTDDADDTWESQDRRWQGQDLVFHANDPDTSDYDLYTFDNGSNPPADDFIRELSFDDKGRVDIDTSSLEGDYVIVKDGDESSGHVYTAENGSEIAVDAPESDIDGDGNDEFPDVEIAVQEFDNVSFASSEVDLNGFEDLEIESNRNGYTINISSDDLTQSELDEMFDHAGNSETVSTPGDDVVQISGISSDHTLNASFSEDIVEEGATYDFDVNVDDTTASGSANITVGEEVDGDANFEQTKITQTRGDLVWINLTTTELDDNDELNLTVTDGTSGGYEANLTVSPEDDEIAIEMNTWNASRTNNVGAVFRAEDGEINETASDTNLAADNRLLDAGLYDVIAEERNLNDEPEEFDITTLELTERTGTNITVHTVPNSEVSSFSNGDLEEINDQMSEGTLTVDDTIAIADDDRDEDNRRGDGIVFKIEIDGVYGALQAAEDQGAGNDSAAFAQLDRNGLGIENLEGAAWHWNINETEGGLNTDGVEETFDQSEQETVIDENNKSIYIIYDAEDISGIDADQSFEAKLNVTDDFRNVFRTSNTTDAEETTAAFETVDREATFDTTNEIVQVQAAADQTISGTTTVAPGTEIRVRARATGDGAFLRSTETTVNSDGSFEATFSGDESFEGVPVGTNFTASIPRQSFDDDAETDGRVVEQVATETPTPDQGTPTETEEPDTPTETEEPDTPTETPTETDEGQPGFGAIVALIALLGAALLAARRNAF